MENRIPEEVIKSMYPDAYYRKFSNLSFCIWSNILNRRLSGFFNNEQDAWESAVRWSNRDFNTPPKTQPK